MFKFIQLKTANDNKHKYEITLQEISPGKAQSGYAGTGKIHKIKFGAHGYDDFTLSPKNTKKKEAYILRHRVREDWTDPIARGTLSRFILWNKPSLKDSLIDYLKRFNIKSSWGVSK
jgi:hypothetical protein